MGCSTTNSPMAVGYWGRNIHQRVIAEQEQAKQRQLLTDQLTAGGIRVALWRGVTEGTKCSCYKESNQQADKKCYSCHGTGVVPGYQKFGYDTVWMASADEDVVLTNTKITTEFKSAKIVLNTSALTGTVESGDKAFTKSIVGSSWEYEVNSFIRVAGSSTIVVEYSLDSGSTWSDISGLTSETGTSGTIRFKATLTRTTTSILSPAFEVVRARYATISSRELMADGSYRWGPWILIMRNMPTSRYVKTEHGDAPAKTELNFWMVGLSLFDPSITFGTSDEYLSYQDKKSSDFVEILDGAAVGTRYVIIDRMHSDPFNYFVQQTFISRLADPVGPYTLIW